MKILALLFTTLFYLNAQGLTLTKLRSSPEGTSSQKFEWSGKKLQYQKNSNYFDANAGTKDYKLGRFELSSKKTESSIRKSIEKSVKANPKDLSKNPGNIGHTPFFIVDNSFVSPKSKLHASLEKDFQKLQALKWNHLEGIEVTEDLKKIKKFKKGKEVSNKLFPVDYYCARNRAPTTCKLKEEGILYVR